MKKGYKRLLIFEIIIFISLILNNFASSILSGYKGVLFYTTVFFIFIFIFGFEKDRHRYWKTICIELLINLLIFFILYYLSGIIIGFVKNLNVINFSYIIKTIIPIIVIIVFQELLRYIMLSKAEGSKLLVTTTIILFIYMGLANYINVDVFSSAHDIFIFVATIMFPTITRNVFTSYLSYKSGYKPAIIYVLCITLYSYLLPIIPNPNQYLYSIIELIVPMIFMYNIYNFFQIDKDEDVIREYHKSTFLSLIFPTMLALFLIYIVSGYFKYQAIVIASGSMTPNILKGDVIIVEKKKDYENLDVGHILVHKHNNIVVVHRIIKKLKIDNHYFFYTKGDNNDSEDNYAIKEEDVIGTVKLRIPYLGYPTVWINNL